MIDKPYIALSEWSQVQLTDVENRDLLLEKHDAPDELELEPTDPLLLDCLVTHLQSEYKDESSEIQKLKSWRGLTRRDIPDRLMEILGIVSNRGTFVGTCSICESWDSEL